MPWGHNLVLLTKLKEREARLAYSACALEHGWSRAVLVHHIEARTLDRQGKALTNFAKRLPKPQSDLARESLKDPYRFDFLGLGAEASELEFLRASHIKPWADCERDAERLDIYNGLLLAPHLDAAFDRGFITVADEGAVVVAGGLDHEARHLLGLDRPLRVHGLAEGHRVYLPWHRERVFKEGVGRG